MQQAACHYYQLHMVKVMFNVNQIPSQLKVMACIHLQSAKVITEYKRDRYPDAAHDVPELTLFSSGSGSSNGTYSAPTHDTMPSPFGRCPGGGFSSSSFSLSMAWKHLDMCCMTCIIDTTLSMLNCLELCSLQMAEMQNVYIVGSCKVQAFPAANCSKRA
jgi:hypothetical protein